MKEKEKPFIPRDKPKSWVIFILSCLSGLLLAGPLAFAGKNFGLHIVAKIGMIGFFICWLTGFIMGFVFFVNAMVGNYKNIENRDWKNQIW